MNPSDENVPVDGLEATVLGTQSPASDGDVCPAGAPTRSFTVHAIQVPIVYNAYGQYDPNGVMYVLDENLETVRNQVKATMVERTIEHEGEVVSEVAPNASIQNPNPDVTVPLVQPLTIRAHQGDCIDITLVNHLDRHASIHPTGVSYDPETSDGMAVGRNGGGSIAAPDGQPGDEVHYRWHAEKLGAFSFADGANPVLHDEDETLKQHGLFGSLVVHEKGSKWLDPETREPLESGAKAIIDARGNDADYREFVVYYHDSASIINSDGSGPKFPNGEEQSLYTLNYRGDPVGARLAEKPDCPDCTVPELFYSSWVHGDPGAGDLVFPAYVGDPIKYRVIGTQAEEKHVHHHHGHRWKSEPGDAKSRTVDSQTISTGATYTQEFVAGFGQFSSRPDMTYDEAFASGGAGYVQGSPGDYIFHCHLFPHYASGMWAILRVLDKAQGDLQPLPDRVVPGPAPATDEDPGFPYFVKEDLDRNATTDELADGVAPPAAPLSLGDQDGNVRQPTAIEESAINGTGTPGYFDTADPIKPGAPYADPCPVDAKVREYDIVILETSITYNNAADHDPNAYVYALEEDEEAIRSGEMRPRPLTIRANVGECVEITMKNRLGVGEDSVPAPNMISMHVHFVGYDVLGSDGVNLGYNYLQGARPGEEISYRWYADEEGTIFWHDHLSGFERAMHGTFGSLVVEPEGSKWLDPYTGEPLDGGDGTHAMIVDPNGENYREFMLFYQDFVRLYDRNGNAINPPLDPNDPERAHLDCDRDPNDPVWCESLEDHGVMGINYANAPLFHRDDEDPAYAFSSWAHGDPMTPLLETYPGDNVKIRVLQGTFEEAHTFTMNGVRWRQEEHDPRSPWVASQTFGVSEQFESHFEAPEQNPAGVRMSDYLYGSAPVDDTWNGMWGLMRVWGHKAPHLAALPGSPIPEERADRGKLGRLKNSGLRTGNMDGPATQERGDSTPPKAPKPGDSCPADAPTRTYDVVAFTHDIQYNEFGDHDPYGIVFATREDYRAIKNGDKAVEPLVIRANKGDCIEVTLENKLPDQMNQHDDHAVVPVNQEWHNSNRISLSAQGLVKYDVQLSDGATVGFNWDQTVGPGEDITYRWYADEEVGTSVLWDMADVRSHRHHGAFGMLVVEPEGSTWRDPYTGQDVTSGAQAVIVPPDGADWEAFREYAVLTMDGMYIVNDGHPKGGAFEGSCPVGTLAGGHEIDLSAGCNQAFGDPEDQGFKGINYRSEPLGPTRRMADDPREHLVFSSDHHGDPATPLFEAFVGDSVRFRVAQPADKPRGVSFHLAGHVWNHHFGESESPYESVYGLSSGDSKEVVPEGGAGGLHASPGDYYYGASKLRGYVEGGMWGVFRVHPNGAKPATGLNDVEFVATPRPTIEFHQSTQNMFENPISGMATMKLTVTTEAGSVARVWVEVDGGAHTIEATSSSTKGKGKGKAKKSDEYVVEFDTTVLDDGDHDVTFFAEDDTGRQTVVTRYVLTDNTAPTVETVTIDGVAVDALADPLAGRVTLNVTALDATSGVETVAYRLDGGEWQELTLAEGASVSSTTVDTTALSDGEHVLEVRVTDGAGNDAVVAHSIVTDNVDETQEAAALWMVVIGGGALLARAIRRRRR